MIKSEILAFTSTATQTLASKTLTSPVLNTPTSNGLSIIQQTAGGVGLTIRNVGATKSISIASNAGSGQMEIVSLDRLDLVSGAGTPIYIKGGDTIHAGNDLSLDRASATTPTDNNTQVVSKSIVFENNLWNGTSAHLTYSGIVSKTINGVNDGTYLSFQVGGANPSVLINTEVFAVYSDGRAKIAALAGTGSRNIVVDANGFLAVGSATPITTITASQTAVINNRYITNNTTLVTITLPTTAAVGDQLLIRGRGTGGWRIAQNANQVIHGATDTTVGTGGSISSQARYDTIAIECIVGGTSTEWIIISKNGTHTIV